MEFSEVKSNTRIDSVSLKTWFRQKGMPVEAVYTQMMDFDRTCAVMVRTEDGWQKAVRQVIPFNQARSPNMSEITKDMAQCLFDSWKWRKKYYTGRPETGRPGKAWEEIGAAWSAWKQMKNGSNSSQ
jgi:hypothetical protein